MSSRVLLSRWSSARRWATRAISESLVVADRASGCDEEAWNIVGIARPTSAERFRANQERRRREIPSCQGRLVARLTRALDATDFRWRQAHVDGRSEDPDQSVIGRVLGALQFTRSSHVLDRPLLVLVSPGLCRVSMADLDDFFAKKDRKKAKGKKFATTDEVAKKLEETGKRIEKPKPKEKPANPEGEESQHTEVRRRRGDESFTRFPREQSPEFVIVHDVLPCLFSRTS